MLLLRHASAGARLSTPTLDVARALDRRGRAQAARLPEALAGYALERIVTSSYARSVQTVAPLARSLGLDVETRLELEPGASTRDARRFLGRLPATTLVCTHREVIESLFDGEIECEKGGAWLLERRGRRLVPTAYLAPPAAATRRVRRRAALV